ncbi:MAG: SulP family inorganic anion transporter [Ilumatobacter sp.]|nr:SulP family inorganic anion transporter [Ilumatobacter sp.]
MNAFGRPHMGDVIAGVSVALVAIPQSLAYAELAGMPAQYGLYATALPSLLAAFFVSSRYLQTGPVALTALLTFGALTPLATPMSDEYIALAALLALLVGVLRVALGVARLGRVAYLLTPPVLVGFTTAAAILILSSQLPKLFDVDPDEGGVIANAVWSLVHLGEWSVGAIVFSAVAFAAIFGGRRVHALFPGVLLAVLVGLLVSSMLDYGGSIVGELDGGFIGLSFDFDWSTTGSLVVPAIAIALVGFAEPSSIARTFARADKEPWNADREMVSQGVANLASAVSGAFPVGGSFSRSSLNRLAGARTAWAGAITGAFVLLALPLTPALHDLPQAILGAIVIGAVLKLIDLRGVWRLRDQSKAQFFVGVITLVATIATAPRVERGVVIGVVVSLVVERLAGERFAEPEVHEPVGAS